MTALASITQDWYNATDSGSPYRRAFGLCRLPKSLRSGGSWRSVD